MVLKHCTSSLGEHYGAYVEPPLYSWVVGGNLETGLGIVVTGSQRESGLVTRGYVRTVYFHFPGLLYLIFFGF